MILDCFNNIVDFIEKFEGFSPSAYKLKGEDCYTIGYGIKSIYPSNNKIIKETDTITKEKARNELICYLCKNIFPILFYINKTNKLNDNQVIALCSLIYNCGLTSFQNSKCYKAICNNDIKTSIQEWDFGIKKVAKEYQNGIKIRRNEEIKLFFNIGYYYFQ